MRINIRYFASLREALGSGESVDAPAGATLASLRDLLVARGEPHASALSRHRAVRCAVDQQVVDESAVLREGAEVAFFPPVTGG
jgi:molybdopterin synthase sulfur carrier subunit